MHSSRRGRAHSFPTTAVHGMSINSVYRWLFVPSLLCDARSERVWWQDCANLSIALFDAKPVKTARYPTHPPSVRLCLRIYNPPAVCAPGVRYYQPTSLLRDVQYCHSRTLGTGLAYGVWGCEPTTLCGTELAYGATRKADDGQWHHLVLTWKSLDGTTVLYLDCQRAWEGKLGQGKLLRDGGYVLRIAPTRDAVLSYGFGIAFLVLPHRMLLDLSCAVAMACPEPMDRPRPPVEPTSRSHPTVLCYKFAARCPVLIVASTAMLLPDVMEADIPQVCARPPVLASRMGCPCPGTDIVHCAVCPVLTSRMELSMSGTDIAYGSSR
eukprot:306306-Rhodomonas_salina.6